MTPSVPAPAPCATRLATDLAQGRLTAEAVALDTLERIAGREPAVHAWETLDRERVIAQARRVDALHAHGQAGMLAGIPVGVKDLIDTGDLPTGYGSPIYRGFRPAADALCVSRLRAVDAVIVGKTVTTELAYFTPGPTMNPWNAAHTPGGSSSGSAAAVASGMIPLALGTQTAGSIIRPASFCGVFGFKPTFGVFAMDGIRPFSPSLDTLGWFARCADDLELMRCALAGIGFEPLDAVPPSACRVGVCRTHEFDALDAGGHAAWRSVETLLPAAGFDVGPVVLPDSLAGLLEAQKTVMAFEAVRAFAGELREQPERLSAPLRALLDTGRQVGEPAYRQALDTASRARVEIESLIGDLDALVVPSARGEAPAGLEATGDPVFCRVWTLLGLPCVNVPGLRGPNGLPIGVQLVGRAGAGRRLLEVAAAVRRVLAAEAGESPDESSIAPVR